MENEKNIKDIKNLDIQFEKYKVNFIKLENNHYYTSKPECMHYENGKILSDTKIVTSTKFFDDFDVINNENYIDVHFSLIIGIGNESDNLPFKLNLHLIGYFKINKSILEKIKDETEKKVKKLFIEDNLFKILFPYARTLISNYTTISGFYPVILPLIEK